MKEKIKTLPDLLDLAPAHQAAVVKGNDHFRLWERNVIDEYKDLPDQEIKDKLKEKAFPYAVCFENVIGDFNMATAIRNANAFGAREVFYLGNKKFDKRGCVGVHNYTDVNWIPSIDEFIKLKDQYSIIGIDNIPGAVSISKFDFKPNTLFVFGEEGVGLTPMVQCICDDIVYIEQFGSVRSLNVGTASGIIMYEFTNKMRSL